MGTGTWSEKGYIESQLFVYIDSLWCFSELAFNPNWSRESVFLVNIMFSICKIHTVGLRHEPTVNDQNVLELDMTHAPASYSECYHLLTHLLHWPLYLLLCGFQEPLQNWRLLLLRLFSHKKDGVTSGNVGRLLKMFTENFALRKTFELLFFHNIASISGVITEFTPSLFAAFWKSCFKQKNITSVPFSNCLRRQEEILLFQM